MSWYYAKNGEQLGPVEEAEFEELVSSGKIQSDTLVWKDGMKDWVAYGTLADVSAPPPISAPGGVDDAVTGSSSEPVAYAGFWIRFVARFIDGILLLAVNLILMIPLAVAGAIGSDGSMDLAVELTLNFIGILIALAYDTYMVGKFGATFGKMALGLKVVRSNGEPLTMMRAFGRYWGTFLSSLTLLIGYIIAGFDSEKRALHDHICDTRVVKTKS
ncbi:MAG: RDD family protein [Verrucomicrobiota bacterium]